MPSGLFDRLQRILHFADKIAGEIAAIDALLADNRASGSG